MRPGKNTKPSGVDKMAYLQKPAKPFLERLQLDAYQCSRDQHVVMLDHLLDQTFARLPFYESTFRANVFDTLFQPFETFYFGERRPLGPAYQPSDAKLSSDRMKYKRPVHDFTFAPGLVLCYYWRLRFS